MRAASEGAQAVLLDLIVKGGDINCINAKGITLLNQGIQYGHLNIVQLLVMLGVKITASHNNGCSPLHVAAKNGDLSII